MEQSSYYVTATAFSILIVCWFAFAWTFLLRKKPQAAPDKVKAPKSFFGIVLQGLGFGLVWSLRRTPVFSPFVPNYTVNVLLQLLAPTLSISCVLLAMSAIRELGKQWSFQARLVEGHKLVTSGVYGLVRHPIYTAMLGNLIATGLVLSRWVAVPVAIVIFLTGTLIRTRLEERLLKNAFGADFEKWKAGVPALIPGLRF
jgi:protein-S-isoprenylcysteine O-methyltransferase Ste14